MTEGDHRLEEVGCNLRTFPEKKTATDFQSNREELLPSRGLAFPGKIVLAARVGGNSRRLLRGF